MDLKSVDTLKMVASDLGQLVSIAYKVIRGDFLAALGFVPIFQALRVIDFVEAKAELMNVSQSERLDIRDAFDVSVSIADPNVQRKIIDSADVLEQVTELVAVGIGVYETILLIVAKVKSILEIQYVMADSST